MEGAGAVEGGEVPVRSLWREVAPLVAALADTLLLFAAFLFQGVGRPPAWEGFLLFAGIVLSVLALFLALIVGSWWARIVGAVLASLCLLVWLLLVLGAGM